ncbi:MAG: acyl-CoA dehydrogenase family protein, partial [Pseudomonadota bacterium]
MDLGVSQKVAPLIEAVREMVSQEIAPREEAFRAEIGSTGNRFEYTPKMTEILEGLKAEAQARGLWNFWLTDSDKGYGLTTVEYAYLAEEMGKTPLGAEVFNCSAPDTGNMEVLERYGLPQHKERWLKPLLAGEIRSAYLMTEPAVASSDATNMALSCVRDGADYILNGEKWWSSGAGDPRCKLYIVMARTGAEDAPKHQRHSMLLVDAETPGIEVLRAMEVYGHDDAP